MLKKKPKQRNEKTEEYFHREVFPMINALPKNARDNLKSKIIAVKEYFQMNKYVVLTGRDADDLCFWNAKMTTSRLRLYAARKGADTG